MTRPPLALLALTAALWVAGCAAEAPEAPGSALGDGHGLVAGATEVADPPSSLATVSPDGAVELLDLVSGDVVEIGAITPPAGVVTDGRFLYALRDGAVEIVDTGVWTQPHGDHVHYYRGDPRVVGTLEGDGVASVTWAGDRTALLFADGEAVVLDRNDLGAGEVEPVARLEGLAADIVAPIEGGLLVGDADADEVRVVDDAGARIFAPVACRDPRAAAPSRPGTVIGCADAAVVAAGPAAEPVLTRVALPDPAATGARSLLSRADRASLAGVASDGSGIWLLDVRVGTWMLLSPPAEPVTAIAVDDADGHTLALLADGSLAVLDGAGTLIGTTSPLVAASLADPAVAPRVRIDVDADRAYLTGPAEGRVWEIDYRDGGRIAREFTIPAGGFAAEVGR